VLCWYLVLGSLVLHMGTLKTEGRVGLQVRGVILFLSMHKKLKSVVLDSLVP
jgi:hypothetical protein